MFFSLDSIPLYISLALTTVAARAVESVPSRIASPSALAQERGAVRCPQNVNIVHVEHLGLFMQENSNLKIDRKFYPSFKTIS